METLAHSGLDIPQRRRGWNGFTWIAGALATIAAAGVAAVLAVFFAATVVVIGLMAAVLIGLGGMAYRARRKLRPEDPTILEARKVGGHSWVAYSWDRRGR